jgi:two-component system, OmpR family, osmolarity sensor histidine kinase EnvZ
MYSFRKASPANRFRLSLMPIVENRLAWLKSGLFWRTFFLLAFLIAVSMAAWVISFRTIERTPRANQIAAQVISVVTITRAALTHSAPDLRRELLFDLASNEGIRIYPREETDVISPPSDTSLMPAIEANVREKLGNDTIFASRVNDILGFWVSFKIDEDTYWLMLDRSRVVGPSGIQWIGWATVTLLLSLIGAVFISRLINQPLARLTAATRAIAKGRQPDPLPEKGPNEIKDANRSFNQMMVDLNQIESDRAIILAGISHDLRTPIARMLLEVELAKLPDDARLGMQSDLAQMDGIIGQFLDYAKPTDKNSFRPVDASALLESAAHDAERIPDVRIQTNVAKNLKVLGSDLELRRVIQNLIENARRYGKTRGTESAHIDISGRIEDGRVLIEVADHGAGIPEGDIDHLLRPFTRMDSARGQANGSGLGLAIVNRIVKQHGGTLRLLNRKGCGLVVQISLAALKKTQDAAV